MSPLQRRFRNTLKALGDAYTVGAANRFGVFTILRLGVAASYLPQGTIDAAGRPMRLAYVPFDDGTLALDTVTWDGLTLIVQRVLKARLRGEIVAKVLVMT